MTLKLQFTLITGIKTTYILCHLYLQILTGYLGYVTTVTKHYTAMIFVCFIVGPSVSAEICILMIITILADIMEEFWFTLFTIQSKTQ